MKNTIIALNTLAAFLAGASASILLIAEPRTVLEYVALIASIIMPIITTLLSMAAIQGLEEQDNE